MTGGIYLSPVDATVSNGSGVSGFKAAFLHHRMVTTPVLLCGHNDTKMEQTAPKPIVAILPEPPFSLAPSVERATSLKISFRLSAVKVVQIE